MNSDYKPIIDVELLHRIDIALIEYFKNVVSQHAHEIHPHVKEQLTSSEKHYHGRLTGALNQLNALLPKEKQINVIDINALDDYVKTHFLELLKKGTDA